jgi:hypothetical protein
METPDLTMSSRAPQDADMDNQLISSNHSSLPNAIKRPGIVDPIAVAHLAAAEILSAVGIQEILIATGDSVRELAAEQAELRRLRAIADERFLHGATGRSEDAPSLWGVRKMAKQLGLSAEVVRRRAARWSYTLCVAHDGCRGGRRGCDLRFRASEAAAWINAQRKVRR